ncbi:MULTISPECIES: DUF3000 family protein [Bifidobacterium]|jgi:hypothetical protein|uniref:DUF3000 family protein n=1 Tax=Bifidobacterium tibiigranuli TaxID=2172043 RepID=A0A5N6S4W8_9BIFI|nr:DUF3000 family protein [Bifidobacterium tibiigranuli]KAE8128023.1 DUF3000 family protein [Bifidobacterium tibiigranuli]KAE8128184.1 hypothetical protein DDF78_06210 [Bifidobacterium tibiigranuli]MCI1211184.1 DUF3000 domain-containing protein [Bifidobacterium tibiigranuli]MCI1220306.1 DUF3000 domain-containing protein [Bifidobacterium tibiigranuli]MCI1232011.1 DUF3000 domain-containing protein [Bifidobacterium tibiigranuli]
MNHIYAFPDAPRIEDIGRIEDCERTGGIRHMSGARHAGERTDLFRPAGVPDAVWSAVLSVMAMRRLDGIAYREIEVPRSLADFGIGVSLRCSEDSSEDRSEDSLGASGWIMALYAQHPDAQWESHWRCTAYARVPYDDCVNDELAAQIVWDEMRMALGPLTTGLPSGTVSVTRDRSFGLHEPLESIELIEPTESTELNAAAESHEASRPEQIPEQMLERTAVGCELRVSWSPASAPGVEIADEIGTHIEAWAGLLHSMSTAETGNSSNEEEIALG